MANPTGKGGFQERPQDINRDGAPKRGQSWQETTKRITDMTRDELVQYVGGKRTRVGRLLASATSNIPIKDAMIIAAVVGFLVDPNPRTFQALSDREDGKPNQPVSANVNMSWSNFVNNDGDPDAETDSE
jgi:hypothetical protein